MKKFQHQLWGYQIDLPDNWNHKQFGQKDGFSEDPDAFLPDYQGKKLAQLLINGEWNSLQLPIVDLWQSHLGKTSLMMGAKNLGSAAWEMAGGQGFEVEIGLAKKSPHRLWAGILENGLLVLTILVLHLKENRDKIEPLISETITSLKYLERVDQVDQLPNGMPLPDSATPVDPLDIVTDIPDPENWQAFQGDFSTGALQAFYLRELPQFGWDITRYVPFPNPGELPFARILLEKDGQTYSLGLMPGAEGEKSSSIVLKTN